MLVRTGGFYEIFKIMDGKSVVIRYLDPPLHEFLPHTQEEIESLGQALNMTTQELQNQIDSLKEFNPMMGHRGCRLAITYPEIARMQTTAVIEAAILAEKEGIHVEPEIMIPLIGDIKEYQYVKEIVHTIAQQLIQQNNSQIIYKIGTMIEVPRAVIIADQIAQEADFFSFGTNDLTQLTYGFSRDDASKFLKDYYEKGIFEQDPFAKIDQEGVGFLMRLGIYKGRLTNPNIELGICGEHAGETSSINFCHNIGLNYVSCSPYRVPVARLAAAKAAIREKITSQ